MRGEWDWPLSGKRHAVDTVCNRFNNVKSGSSENHIRTPSSEPAFFSWLKFTINLEEALLLKKFLIDWLIDWTLDILSGLFGERRRQRTHIEQMVFRTAAFARCAVAVCGQQVNLPQRSII